MDDVISHLLKDSIATLLGIRVTKFIGVRAHEQYTSSSYPEQIRPRAVTNPPFVRDVPVGLGLELAISFVDDLNCCQR